MARGMVANVELFPSLCSVALDHIPPFLIKHFGINKETKAGQIPQHSAWKRCKTGVTIIMKGNQYPIKYPSLYLLALKGISVLKFGFRLSYSA